MNGLRHLVKGFNLGFESFIDVPTKSLKNDYFSFFSSSGTSFNHSIVTQPGS